MLTSLSLFLIGLVVMVGFAPVLGLLSGKRRRDRLVRRVIGAAILLGYIGAGALVWSLTPPAWKLPFGETLTAAVNAKTYGHPTEHYAQGIVVMMLFACAAGALIGGALAAATARLWKPARNA
jgi:hypothetical protein